MIASEKIFREYDIRGTVDTDFDAAFVRRLGVVYAALVRESCGAEQPDGKKAVVAVGRDCRLSGEALVDALSEGLREGGVDVLYCGMGPTPQLYYSVITQKVDGGIQVTGSHNPPDQNGFKMMVGQRTLSGDDIRDLRSRVFAEESPIDQTRGEFKEFDAQAAYISELIERSKPHMGSRRLKVVVDAGNGVGGMVGPAVLRGLGCEVIELYTEPDGRFPNHHPDPTVLENIVELRKRVVEDKADLGIGWDGDADRIGVVDELGNPIYGDMLLVIFGRQLLKEISKPTIIGDVKCSKLLFSDLSSRGANAVMAKTGHSLIKAKLKELSAELAGEMSGHIFFAHRYYGFDDAIHSSARLLEIMSSCDKPLSELLGDLPKMVSTPEIRLDCPEEQKFAIVEKAQQAFPEYEVNTLDGVRVEFENGWGLVRASNTQAALVMRFEAETDSQLSEYQKLVEDRIAKLRSEL